MPSTHWISFIIMPLMCSWTQYIDVPGTIAICKALQTNRQLRFIDLGLNRVRKVRCICNCFTKLSECSLLTFSEGSGSCYRDAGSEPNSGDPGSKVQLHSRPLGHQVSDCAEQHDLCYTC